MHEQWPGRASNFAALLEYSAHGNFTVRSLMPRMREASQLVLPSIIHCSTSRSRAERSARESGGANAVPHQRHMQMGREMSKHSHVPGMFAHVYTGKGEQATQGL